MTSNTEIILAAVNSVGHVEDPAQFEAAVTERAREILLMLSEKSPVMKSLARLSEAVPITGTVIDVYASKRGDKRAVVIIDSGTDRPQNHPDFPPNSGNFLPDGQEAFRTEWLDSPNGKRIANTAHSLKGHRVMAYKYNEARTDGSGQTTRIVEHIVDLGQASAAVEAA